MTRVPDQEAKKSDGGGGARLIGLPPQQLHSHHATDQRVMETGWIIKVTGDSFLIHKLEYY